MNLMKKLVCPDRNDLGLDAAPPDLIANLARLQDSGKLAYRNGDPVESPITDGLVRADHQMFYRVVDGVPVLLVEEGIPIESTGGNS